MDSLTVNGEPILEEWVEQEFSQIKSQYESMGKVSCCERNEEFRGYARENIISRMLLTQEARHAVKAPDEGEIDEAAKKIKEAHGGEEQFYQTTGLTSEQEALIRKDIASNIQVEKLIEKICRAHSNPADETLKKYYENHLELFMTEEEVQALHILKAPRKVEDREAAYQELRKVRRQLLDGENFQSLAKTHSIKPDEETDLGFFKRGELMEEFQHIAFSMNIGENSPVFSTQYGFHLIQVANRKEKKPKPFNSIQEEVLQFYLEDRRTEAIGDFVKGLKEKATITGEEPPQPKDESGDIAAP
ncbi:MAG TPA: hypothetical protein EYG38_13955 [Verrucomicrobia bacterium]|nr:hypothetical protein [Verrucomicrobiota bacterium]